MPGLQQPPPEPSPMLRILLHRSNISNRFGYSLKGITMKRFFRPALVTTAAALAFWAANAAATVTVTFTQPEGYVDMPFAPWDKERVMKDLQSHFEKLGAKLPLGQDLKVEVLDIDLAGRIEPQLRFGHDIRILKGRADWPAIQLRYSIESQGKVLRSGDARVDDKSYLDHVNRYSANESLRYEKRMLDDWFKTVMKQ